LSLRFYFDENADAPIAEGLRQRGVDVLTVQEDGLTGEPDPVVLDRAGQLGRVLFTRDTDFLREATRRMRAGQEFATVVYARQVAVSIRTCIEDLEMIAVASTEAEARNLILHLPL
jgi:predicted nuclease of predicted toxin-antitoxin system